jgi:microcystin degradation protein MlrC
MRIATLGIHHETNTFSARPVTLETFQSSGLQTYGVQRGQQCIQMHRGASTSLSGYIRGAEKLGFELVPLIFAATDPAGTISTEAFESLASEGIAMLREQGPFDGVLLNQMGAAVCETARDMDGEFARRVREAVGPGVPIVMTLDLHANVSQLMAEQTDAIVIYRTNPHMDAVERALDACELVTRMVRENWRPAKWLEMPPMVIGIFQHDTSEQPMRSVIESLERVLEQPGVVSASVGQGYPWGDAAELGFAAYALHEDSLEQARLASQEIARTAWNLRSELYRPDGPAPDEAVRIALESARNRAPGSGPVVLLDVGDNIGAGSSGDSTFLLVEAIRQGAKSWLQTIRDTEAVATCVKAGVGSHLELEIGGKTDSLHGDPVRVTGRVRVISDGRFEDSGGVHAGWRYFDGGTTVGLETDAGPTVVLVSTRVGNMSRAQFYSIGYRPEKFDIVVAKGVVSPRPAYAPIASRMISVNSPGATSGDLLTFNYLHRRRPLYPFEPDAVYEP